MWLFGGELDSPETAITLIPATVARPHGGSHSRQTASPRTRSGPPDGFEAFLAELEILECADVSAQLPAVAQGASAEMRAWLLLAWIAGSEALGPVTLAGLETWREDQAASGILLLASTFGGVEPAATLAHRSDAARERDSPLITIGQRSASVDILLAAHRPEALELASSHPLLVAGDLVLWPYRSSASDGSPVTGAGPVP